MLLLYIAQPVGALTVIGHYLDTSWGGFEPSSGTFTSIEVDILVEKDPGESTYFYYSNTAYFTGNGNIVYGGIQTNGYSGTAWIGKMAIFSVWNATSGIAEPGGWATPFGGEGVGYSVRIPYNWVANHAYTFKMYLSENIAGPDSLWAASLYDSTSGVTTRIGRIYVPDSWGTLKTPITFHERYFGTGDTCSDVEASQVKFSNMSANNRTVSSTWWNNYNQFSGCPDTIWSENTPQGVRSYAGIQKPAPEPPAPVTNPSAPVSNPTPSSSATSQPTTQEPVVEATKPQEAVAREVDPTLPIESISKVAGSSMNAMLGGEGAKIDGDGSGMYLWLILSIPTFLITFGSVYGVLRRLRKKNRTFFNDVYY